MKSKEKGDEVRGKRQRAAVNRGRGRRGGGLRSKEEGDEGRQRQQATAGPEKGARRRAEGGSKRKTELVLLAANENLKKKSRQRNMDEICVWETK